MSCIFERLFVETDVNDKHEPKHMHVVTHTSIRLLSVVTLSLFLTSCNIQGFFTSYGDDPVWEDPNAAAIASDAGGAAGGPGKAIYGRICAACHLGSGKGVLANNIPSLAGSELVQGDAATPIKIVLHGLRGPINRNGQEINGQMAAWKDQLSDQEIADVLTYVRSSFGNSSGEVTVDDVSGMREETADRLIPYTEGEL